MRRWTSASEALSSTSDAAVNRGAHHQRRLWPSTLPLGRDAAGYSRVYATRNIGDCVPLAGTGCGSPDWRSVRVRVTGQDSGAVEPGRPGARQPDAARRRQVGVGQDDDGEHADRAVHRARGRPGVRDRPRRPLLGAYPPHSRRAPPRYRLRTARSGRSTRGTPPSRPRSHGRRSPISSLCTRR